MTVKNGQKAIYFAPVEEEYFKKWEYYQVDLEMLKRSFKEVIICHNIWVFIKTLCTLRVNFVYCWWWHQSVVCVLLSRLLRIPVYVTGAVHMYDESGSPDFFSKGPLFRIACRLSWRMATCNLFISKSQFRQICSHESVRSPELLRSSLGAGFNLDNLKSSRNIRDRNSEIKCRMLIIVWMTKDTLRRKSVYEVLAALVELKQRGIRDFQLTIAGGKGDGSSDLAQAVVDMNLGDEVRLDYDISNNDKLSLYKGADIYVQPSYYEGFGNAVLEAMSFGLPAIVSRNTAQAEVLGESGFIVEEIDATSIANVLSKFICMTAVERQAQRNMVIRTIEERHLFEYRVHRLQEIIRDKGLK